MSRRCSDGMCGALDCARCRPFASSQYEDEDEEDDMPGNRTQIIPDGCVCDPATWDDSKPIPEVCKRSPDAADWGSATECCVCEHDRACHRHHPPTPKRSNYGVYHYLSADRKKKLRELRRRYHAGAVPRR